MKRIFEVRADQGLKPGGPWSRLYGDSMGSAWQNVKGLVRVASSFGGGSQPSASHRPWLMVIRAKISRLRCFACVKGNQLFIV